MKKFTAINWIPLLVLTLLAFPSAPLTGQTEAELREIKERQAQERLFQLQEAQEIARLRAREELQQAEQLYRIAREEALHAREFRGQEREGALRVALEHAQQVGVRSSREAQHAVQEALVRVRERQGDIRQEVVRIRARVRIGVSLDAAQGEEFDKQGALLKDVMEDSPAEAAGLHVGDIITHINGQSLTSPIPDEGDEEFDDDASLPVQRLMALAGDLEDGEEVEVRYIRGGASASVTLEAAEIGDNWFSVGPGVSWGRVYTEGEDGPRTIWLRKGEGEDFRVELLPHMEDLQGKLEELHIKLEGMDFGEGNAWTLRTRPNASFFGPGESMFFRGEEGGNFSVLRGDNDFSFNFLSGARFHGLELHELNPELGAYFSTDRGVLVMEVDEDSALGLEAGDVIISIGDREVENTRDVFRILGSYEDEEAITFTIMRHGQERKVEGTLG